METITIIKKRIRSARAPLTLLRQRTVPPILIIVLSLICINCNSISMKEKELYTHLLSDIYSYHSSVHLQNNINSSREGTCLDTIYVLGDDSLIISSLKNIKCRIGLPTLTRRDESVPVYCIERVGRLSFVVWECSYGYVWTDNRFQSETGGGYIYEYKINKKGFFLHRKKQFWI